MNIQADLVPGPFPKKLSHSLAWRSASLLRAAVGDGRWTRFILEAAWVTRRMALEALARTDGEKFFDVAYPSLGFLKKNLLTTERLLDLGCGTGRIARAVAPLCKEVVAVDYDAGLVKRAARLGTMGNIRWIHADVGSGLSSEIAGSRFDWVVCSHVLEHLFWDQAARLLQELAGLGSRIVVELPDFAADPLNEMRRRQGLTWVSDADHKQEFTVEILAGLLQGNGWKVESLAGQSGNLLAVAVSLTGTPS